VLLSSTRKLQTAAQLMQVQKQQDEIARQRERLDDQRKIKLLQELQDAGTRLGQVRAKLQSTGEKLLYTSARSQVVGESELKPEFAVVRKGKNGRERIVVEQDSELQPGDVVEVALRLNDVAGKDKLAQAAGLAALTEPTATAASTRAWMQKREDPASALAGSATVGRADSASEPAPNAATASSEVARTNTAAPETADGPITGRR
jgi:polysaccharide export outer membrane protein